MSRIQQILEKASREGVARRTTAPVDAVPPLAGATAVPPIGMPLIERVRPADVPDVRPVAPADAAAARGDGHLPRALAHARLAPSVVAALAPDSPVAERFRQLRARLLRREHAAPLRAVLVTSPGTGDGKTITAVNLAMTMAQEVQRQVLLVDCDFRGPRVHALLGLQPSPGLADVLVGAATLDAALVHLPEHHLTVLTAGTSPSHHVQLTGSTPMRRLLDLLRTRYDRIIIDTPPAAVVADAAAMAPMVDGVLVVVRAGHTTRPAIERALAQFEPARLAGFVLNDSGLNGQESAYRAH